MGTILRSFHGINRAELEKLQRDAENNTKAKLKLGLIYISGITIFLKFFDTRFIKDTNKGRELIISAAEQNDIEAIIVLARGYAYGDIGESDFDKTCYWLSYAKAMGSPSAHYWSAILNYEKHGHYEEEDIADLKFAVDKNNSDAQYELAIWYLNEQAGSYQEALNLLSQAADGGHAKARFTLRLIKQGQKVKSLETAHKKLLKKYPKFNLR